MRLAKAVAAMAVMIAVSASAPWAAEEKSDNAPNAANGEKIASQVCAACHGPDGNSPLPVNPKIAGQPAAYLAKQLRDFKANKDRKNPIMLGMATPLSAADMRDVAAHYAAQKPRPGAAQDKDLVALGQKLYRGGNPASGLPACAACHGPNGSGMPALYPRLAGQHADYTAAQIKAFRSNERANDGNQTMRMIAARMTDQEVAAVAQYAAGLR